MSAKNRTKRRPSYAWIVEYTDDTATADGLRVWYTEKIYLDKTRAMAYAATHRAPRPGYQLRVRAVAPILQGA